MDGQLSIFSALEPTLKTKTSRARAGLTLN